ncbi:MAG: hypothetical protein Q9202_003015 [Teloschistes flavicans]
MEEQDVDAKAKHSASFWTKCVVKHLRTDQRRNDVHHAHREISRLCHPLLQRHPNIVNLISWGISLDALESVSLNSLSTPLLILERAYCDLGQFIRSENYDIASYEFLCDRCLEVGRGLTAVHLAGIIHGDLKLENILLFQNDGPSETIWTAKLCDFGSAVPISFDARETSRYLGSDTWLPPECYERNLIGRPMPESLIPCDIFVYGLVVWAVFVGIHFSPLYHMQSADGHGAAIVRNLGRQLFYAKAYKSVTASYVAGSTAVHKLVVELTEQAFTQFGGGREREGINKRQSRRSQGFGRFSSNDTSETTENKIRRVLMVLRGCLNDSPHRRDPQIWSYLNYKMFPVIPRVDDPDTFEPEQISNCLVRDECLAQPQQPTANPHFVPSGSSRAAVLKRLKQSLTHIHHFLRDTVFFGRVLNQLASTYFLFMLRSVQYRISRPSARQRAYDKILGNFPDYHPDASLSEYLNHQVWEEHRDLSILQTTPLFRNHLTVSLPLEGSGHQYSDYIYAIARIRSLAKLCCWQQGDVSLRASHRRTVSAYLASEDLEHGVLAWLCHGEVGRYELQKLYDAPAVLWTFLFNSHLTFDEKTEIVLVLFEHGCDLADILHHDGESATAFLWYLRQAYRDEQALKVTMYFQRIADDETCPLKRRYFLTGRVSVLTTNEDVSELMEEGMTTALHEAVKAANYPLVVYLIRMRFDVLALDHRGKQALELAQELNAEGSSSSLNSIATLLAQNKAGRRTRFMKSIRLGPRLGWTEIRTGEGQSIRAWQETSVEGHFDAITFVCPDTGLYDSDRITLGRIQGQDQVYRLDPMRFLKMPLVADVPSEYKSATTPRFGDEWYEEDARIVAEPLPFQPLSDERAWIRYPATGFYSAVKAFDVTSIPFVVFGVLSLCTRLPALQKLELPTSVIAIGLFAWGTSKLEAPVKIYRLFGLKMSSYNKILDFVLWNNTSVLFIGLSAVAHGQPALIKTILIGFLLCDSLWTLGLPLLLIGLKRDQYYFNNLATRTNTNLGVLSAVFSSILTSFYVTTDDLANVLFLSRAVSIICLLLWIGFLFFRQTHVAVFDDEDIAPASYPLLLDRFRQHFSRPIPSLVAAAVCLVFLGFCADSLIRSLMRQPPLIRYVMALFVVPPVTRAYMQYWYFRLDLRDFGDAPALGAMVNTALFIAPCLVILGWIMRVSMTLHFSLMETISLNLAIWIVSYQVQDGMTTYFNGASMVLLYVLIALGMGFALKQAFG